MLVRGGIVSGGHIVEELRDDGLRVAAGLDYDSAVHAAVEAGEQRRAGEQHRRQRPWDVYLAASALAGHDRGHAADDEQANAGNCKNIHNRVRTFLSCIRFGSAWGSAVRCGSRRRGGIECLYRGAFRVLGLLHAAYRRVILRVIAHQAAIVGQRNVAVFQRIREHDDNYRIVGIHDGAVVHVQLGAVHEVAVFMRDLVLLLVELEVVLRLGLQHDVDEAGEIVLLRLKQVQAVDHLPRRAEIVLVELRVNCLRVLAHVRRDQLAIMAVCTEVFPQELCHVVVGVYDRPLEELRILHSGDGVVHGHLAVMYLLGVDHVQRHLVHAARDQIRVPVEEVLLTGHGVAVAERDVLGVYVVLRQELVDDLVPGLVLEALVVLPVGKRGGQQRRYHAQRCKKAYNFSLQLHILLYSSPSDGRA